jgi:hypothetical protein
MKGASRREIQKGERTMDMNTITYDEYLYDVDSLLMLETGYPTTEAMLPDVYTG